MEEREKWHLPSTFCQPDILHVWLYLLLSTNCEGSCYYLHSIDVKNETQQDSPKVPSNSRWAQINSLSFLLPLPLSTKHQPRLRVRLHRFKALLCHILVPEYLLLTNNWIALCLSFFICNRDNNDMDAIWILYGLNICIKWEPLRTVPHINPAPYKH